MNEWVDTTLGEVARITIGKTPPRKDAKYWTDDLSNPFCTIADLQGRYVDPRREGVTDLAISEGKAKRFPAGSLMMSFKLSIGRVGFAVRDVYPNEAIARLESLDPELEERFLALWLESQDLVEGSGRAVKGNTLNGPSLRAIRVSRPPLAEQHRIIDVVAAVDAQTEAVTEEVRRLQATATRLRADLFGSLPPRNVPAGAMFDMLLGRQKSARQSVGDHVLPYLRAANISTGALSLGDVQKMNFEPYEQVKYGLQSDDIVLVEGGSLGQAARWAGEVKGVVGFDKHVIRLRARAGISTSEYALQWCHWARETGAFDAQATGITIKALGFGRASSMPVPDLTVAEQEALTAPIAGLEATLCVLRSELADLRMVRSALLTALMNREIEIRESYDDLLEAAS